MGELSISFDRGTLVLSDPHLSGALIPPGFVSDPRINGRFRAPAIDYRRSVNHLINAGLEFIDRARNYNDLSLNHRMLREAFPHQQAGFDAWVAARRRGCVLLPTGAGKSYLAEMAIAHTQRSTLVVVPTLDLVSQWARRLALAFATPVGMIGGGSFDVQDLTVSTYDSAYLHMDKLGNRFGLIVFDEVHHLPSEAFSQAAELAIAPFRLGLTATLERADGAHLLIDQLVGPVVYEKSVTELRGRYLSDYDVVRVDIQLSDEERAQYEAHRAEYLAFVRKNGIRMGGPQGWQRFIQATCRSNAGRRAFAAYRQQRQIALTSESKLAVLSELFAEHSQDITLFFANDNPTVHDISRRFLVPVITHETGTKERRNLLDGLAQGRWRVLGTSRVLNEGVDLPDASVGIIISGTGSVREHVQRLGRILRHRKGKRAVLYELVTAGTVDADTSERRRDHEAYRQEDPSPC
jgi:superfamily II DNA or RNA helicase